MKLEVQDILETKGEGENFEDRGGVSGNYAWVIDGATSLFEEKHFSNTSDAAWLAERVNTYLKHPQPDWENQSLVQIMKSISKSISDESFEVILRNKLTGEKLPSYAIALARLKSGRIEYLFLGDCCLLLKKNNSIYSKTDPKFTESPRSIYRHDRELVVNSLRRKRSKMNTPEGYWIGSIDGKGFDHAESGSAEVSQGDSFILTTDGLFRIIKLFQSIGLVEFFNQRLCDTLDQLRMIESNSPLVDRLKRSDDVFAIRCTII